MDHELYLMFENLNDKLDYLIAKLAPLEEKKK